MINNNLKKSLVFLTIACTLIASTGCSVTKTVKETAAADSKKQLTEVDKIKQAGKIVLGTSADWPPSEFHTEINGKDEIVGSDISIAKEIAKDLGVELEIKDMKFDGLLPALQTEKVDFVLSGMVPTEERKQSVDFSKIYHTGEQGILIRVDSKDNLKTVNDLSGKTVGVQKGSIQKGIAEKQLNKPNIKELASVSDLVMSLKTKKVDAVLVGIEVGNAYVTKNNDIILMNLTLKSDYEGTAVAVQKNSPYLLNSINSTIDKLIQSKAIDKFISDAQELAEK